MAWRLLHWRLCGHGCNVADEMRKEPQMNKCPKCGHVFKAKNQIKGGKARWSGMSKADRKQAASAAAHARWSKKIKP